MPAAPKVHWGSNDTIPVKRERSPSSSDDDELAAPHARLEEEDDSIKDEHDERPILALIASKGKVGAAVYDPRTKGLEFVLEQSDGGPWWDFACLVVTQTLPSLILTSNASDPSFSEALEKLLNELVLPSSRDGDEDDSKPKDEGGGSIDSVKVEYRPMREFGAYAGQLALAKLVVGSSPLVGADGMDEDEAAGDGELVYMRDRERGTTEQGARNAALRAAGWVGDPSASPLTVACIGALYAAVQRRRVDAGELLDAEEGDYDCWRVSVFRALRFDKLMRINADALESLQIFKEEAHASLHSSRTKEGLSLFGMMNHTRTPAGRSLLRTWFLRPSADHEVILSRQDAIACFARSDNQHLVDEISRKYLKDAKNVRSMMNRFKMGRETVAGWTGVLKYLRAVVLVRELCGGMNAKQGVDVVQAIMEAFDPQVIKQVGETVNDMIDWDESLLQKRVCVRRGRNDELDELRTRYDGLGSYLSHVAEDVAEGLPGDVAEVVQLVYFPQLGYLLAVPRSAELEEYEDLEERTGLQHQFQTEEVVYYKNERCKDLDRHLGDLRSLITDKEIEIVHSLTNELLKIEDTLCAVADIIAELDCLFSLAYCAREYGWNRPQITFDPMAAIKGGRHPLVELRVPAFVPNDYSQVGGRGEVEGWETDLEAEELNPHLSLSVLTGATFSGKSVYIKQQAIIIYLAHIGSFVPAEYALIGLTDAIFTRVNTKESVTRGTSAFMIDLQQISFALRNATRHSLVVMDEFGKGTESDDGAGLFCSVIQHLAARGEDCPRLLAATHFQHVFANGLMPSQVPITHGHMEIQLSGNRRDGEEIAYLYRFMPGIALSSQSNVCAAQFGIPAKILARAEVIGQHLLTFDLAKIIESELTVAEKREYNAVNGIAKRFLEWDVEEEREEWEEGSRDELLERINGVIGDSDSGTGSVTTS